MLYRARGINRWWAAVPAGVALLAAMLVARAATSIVLPSGWILNPPPAAYVQTGTMPQGMSASPDGATIAVVESGYNPPTLGLYRVPVLTRLASIRLPGAFGRPVWRDGTHVLVAGANADALLDVDVSTASVRKIALPKHCYPIFVATSRDGATVAVATDGDGSMRVGSLESIGSARPIAIGGQPGGIAFDETGKSVFATSRGTNDLVKVDVASGAVQRVRAGLHPGGLAVTGEEAYVAQSDSDAIGIYDARDLHAVAQIPVGDTTAGTIGASPNAVTTDGANVLVTLGAANEVVLIRDHRVAGRVPAGWYPTDALAAGNKLYVLDGKGEGARPNPKFRLDSDVDYIGTIEFGSLRAYPLPDAVPGSSGSPQGAAGWSKPNPSTVVRANGPIAHVFFILKENRTYDQVLGDAPGGNGDAALAQFGHSVTPNEHAIAGRFGLFDNAYTSGEVSVPGHMWSDAAFANDYLERFWPALYGGRFTLDDMSRGDGPYVPARGFLWDSARRAGVTFRDFGEQTDPAKSNPKHWVPTVTSLRGRIDPLYPGWDLHVSDLDRFSEWRRDFTASVAAGTLPQLEFIWLPGDHTFGNKPGELAPASYVAINDYALGRIIETLSRSKVWASSAMFVIEDDSQDGPDHVSDQRTTMFVVSPYARGGVRHEHFATTSILRTIEVMLGMQPLSNYDAMAVPMSAAFGAARDLRPYAAIAPKIDVTRRNGKVAYGAALSAQLDFSRPDAAPAGVLRRILAQDR
jgi:DNA-binding beta-propeller fold protein YncE